MSVERWTHETELKAQLDSPFDARAFVTNHLLGHGLPGLVDDVQLVVSELATNAVRHAQTPFTVTLRAFNATVRLEVLDGWGVEPTLVTAGPEDDGGRGVSIVDAVSREWGVISHGVAGKSVWAEFNT
jgi:anti-sigma regulatory factor (Ser/Thr protein kinase)